MIGEHDINLNEARIGGAEVHSYFVCKKRLWLFSHAITMEHTSDRVDYARLVHETSYPKATDRELLIDGLLCIDFDDSSGTIHEIKLSKAFYKAHLYQLLYYLYYLKQKGVEGLKGEINYPKQKRRETVELTLEDEKEMEEILKNVRAIKESVECPQIDMHSNCKKCSYENFCWG